MVILGVDCENLKKNPARFIYTIKEDFYKPKDQGKLDNTSNICFRYIYTFYQLLICLNGLLSFHIMFV